MAATDGTLRVPTPDYLTPGSFGSLELKQSGTTEFIGQPIDYSDAKLTEIRTLTIDSFGLAPLDLIKIDVEGMELEVLAGAAQTIGRCRPIILVEHLKTGRHALVAAFAPHGYHRYYQGPNVIAIHPTDPSIAQASERRG